VALPKARAHVEHVADITNKGVMRKLQVQRLANAEQVGQRMTQRTIPEHVSGGPLSDISQAAKDLEAGRISQEDFDTAMEVAGQGMRGKPTATAPSSPEPAPISPGAPGSGLQAQEAPAVSQEPILPKLRAAADPMETVPAFVRSNVAGAPTEGLLPYYPRGGRVEQAVAPKPALSTNTAQADMAIRLERPDILAQFPATLIRDRLAKLMARKGSLRPSQVQTAQDFLAEAP
jgi:hypothetical protein